MAVRIVGAERVTPAAATQWVAPTAPAIGREHQFLHVSIADANVRRQAMEPGRLAVKDFTPGPSGRGRCAIEGRRSSGRIAPGAMDMDELRVVSANGLMHGNGFPTESLEAGLAEDPHVVGVDAGSTDGGPYYLGSGENMHASRAAAKEVLRVLLTRTRTADVPLLVGSAATAGRDDGVDWTCDLVREVADEEGLSFDLARIYAEQDAADLREHVEEGAVSPLDESGPLTACNVDGSEAIVAMMGPEPYVEALERGADVVIAGRSSDVAIYKAMALREGFDEGLATHLAKTIECGGLIARPRTGGECVLGVLTDDAFRVRPTNQGKYTDPITIASHLLYETADPTRFVEPRGVLHTDEATYEAVDDRTVAVRGSQFEHSPQYTVKLEGAREVGHRGVAVAGVRDPAAIEEIDDLVETAEAAMSRTAAERGLSDDDYLAAFHVYGRDGTMGGLEPDPTPCHELGVFVDVVAPTPAFADDLLEEATYHVFVSDFPGRKTTAGNVAFPTSPSHAPTGPAYEFSVWHTLAVADPIDPFDVVVEPVRGDAP